MVFHNNEPIVRDTNSFSEACKDANIPQKVFVSRSSMVSYLPEL